jgi:hypothetical protein
VHFTRLFAPAMTKPVTAALLGCGEFGRSLIAQARRLQGLRIAAAFDLDPARVSAALAGMGVAPGEILVTDRIEEALSVPGLDMVVEATGHAEAAAGHALAAIERGIGVAMVSKEAECVIGPVLAARARAAGVAYTLVDGDQPALLIGLVSWARLLGLPIVAAGKSSEYDYVLDPATGRTRWTSEEVASPGLPGLMGLGGDVSATLARRAEALAGLPQRTGPDYCEMALVANATGLPPARPDFHAPLARTPELPEIYGPRASGGVLERTGVLDVFNCLRRTDEASFAGGVFVVVELADERTGELFHGKGIPRLARPAAGLGLQPFPPAGRGGAGLRHGGRPPRPFHPGRGLPAGGGLGGTRRAGPARGSCADHRGQPPCRAGARCPAAARSRRAGRGAAALLHGGGPPAAAAGPRRRDAAMRGLGGAGGQRPLAAARRAGCHVHVLTGGMLDP